MKSEPKPEEILKGCEHDGSYIPVSEVKRLMQKYADLYHKEKLGDELHRFSQYINKIGWSIPKNEVEEYLKSKE